MVIKAVINPDETTPMNTRLDSILLRVMLFDTGLAPLSFSPFGDNRYANSAIFTHIFSDIGPISAPFRIQWDGVS